ncbi:MAG: hypothetical protein QW279_08485 [Candidatus Jordarchaeaceae archaeon]
MKTAALKRRRIRKIPIIIIQKDFKGGVLKNKIVDCPLAGRMKFRCGHMECPYFVKALNGYVICNAKKNDTPLNWMRGKTPKKISEDNALVYPLKGKRE